MDAESKRLEERAAAFRAHQGAVNGPGVSWGPERTFCMIREAELLEIEQRFEAALRIYERYREGKMVVPPAQFPKGNGVRRKRGLRLL